MAAHLTRVTVKGFKKCCVSDAADELMICCGMRVKRMGMLGVSTMENEGTDCEDGDSDTNW